MAGCRTAGPVVSAGSAHHDTLYIAEHIYDSVYIEKERTTEYRRGKSPVAVLSAQLPGVSVSGVSAMGDSDFSGSGYSGSENPFPCPVECIPDTVYITERTIEYRYRERADSTARVTSDSVPAVANEPAPRTRLGKSDKHRFTLLENIGLAALLMLLFIMVVRQISN